VEFGLQAAYLYGNSAVLAGADLGLEGVEVQVKQPGQFADHGLAKDLVGKGGIDNFAEVILDLAVVYFAHIF
jgi:hypothetical protein